MGRPRKYQIVNSALIERLIEGKRETSSEATVKGYHALLSQLRAFLGMDYASRIIDASVCREFAAFLASRLKPSSCRTYLQQLSTLLSEAESSGLIERSPMSLTVGILPRHRQIEKVFLTKPELVRLRNTPCPHESTRDAFLFACYTGLMLTDIETLRWDNVQFSDGQWTLVKNLDKSGMEARVPLVRSSRELLAKIRDDYGILPLEEQDGNVFHLLSRSAIGEDLALWGRDAGLDKPLSFIVARHTFGTLSIASGVDLYTLSRWLGHSSLATAKAYADMLRAVRQSDTDALEAALA